MHEAALSVAEDSDRLSFLHAVRVVRRKLSVWDAIPPSGEKEPPPRHSGSNSRRTRGIQPRTMESARRETQDEQISVAAETPCAEQVPHHREFHSHSQVNSIGFSLKHTASFLSLQVQESFGELLMQNWQCWISHYSLGWGMPYLLHLLQQVMNADDGGCRKSTQRRISGEHC